MSCRGDRLAHIPAGPACATVAVMTIPVAAVIATIGVAVPVAAVVAPVPVATVTISVPTVVTPVPVATVVTPIPVAAVVATIGVAVPIAAVTIPVAMVVTPVPVPAVAATVRMVAERLLRLMNGGADRRTHLLSGSLGLGLGRVRCRGDRLAHIPGSPPSTSVVAPVRVPAVAAVTSATSVAVTIAPVRVPAVAAMAAPVAPVVAPVRMVAVAATTFARVRAATAATTTASVGKVGIDRQEGNVHATKEWHQCDDYECQEQPSGEHFHVWNLPVGIPQGKPAPSAPYSG